MTEGPQLVGPVRVASALLVHAPTVAADGVTLTGTICRGSSVNPIKLRPADGPITCARCGAQVAEQGGWPVAEGLLPPHGYRRYSYGCRCPVCRQAKADYMRGRRATARATAQAYTDPRHSSDVWADGARRYLAPIARHGTRAGYDEHGCRCPECTAARTADDNRWCPTSNRR